MSEEKKCCHPLVNVTENNNCQHSFYKSLGGKDYCVFHYPDIKGKKDEDIQIAFYELIKKSNEDHDKTIVLNYSVFGGIVFRGEIKNSIDFSNSEFTKDVHFDGCKFLGSVDFSGSEFKGYADFKGNHVAESVFKRHTDWEGSQFSEDAKFSRCRFRENAYFSGRHFSENAYFSGCRFSKYAFFSRSKFSKKASFEGCEFFGDAVFEERKFFGDADFKGCEFTGSAYFNKSQFSKVAGFHRVRFHKIGDFKGAIFHFPQKCELSFNNTTFEGVDFRKLDLSGVDLANACLKDIQYNKKGSFIGINASSCWGNMQFRRFAMDQAYIEELHINRRSTLFNKKWEAPKKTFSVWLFLWRITSNYGRNIGCWIFWSVLFAILFGLVYAPIPCPEFLPDFAQDFLCWLNPTFKDEISSKFSPFYFSIVTFTTLGFGDITPTNQAGQIWVTAEVVLGYIMLGGLISILANKLARRAD